MSIAQSKQSNGVTDATRDAWDRIAAGYDQDVTPTHFWLGTEGLKRAGLKRGRRFLDVAAGSGALSIPAAKLGASVLATDLAPAMLAQLSKRAAAEGLSIETRIMDGHALELDDETFDVSGSQFGVMLFPEAATAVRELARVTRRGGRVLVTVYGSPREIDFIQFFVRAIRAVAPEFPGLPTDPPPLPFQFERPETLHATFADAGLDDVRVETITESLRFPVGDALWRWLVNSNPVVGNILADLALTTGQERAVQSELERLVSARARDGDGDGEVAVLTNPIHIGTATRT